MISDTLSDAMAAISRYRQVYPDIYDRLASDLDALVNQMETLRRQLDQPPTPPTPPVTERNQPDADGNQARRE